MKKFIKIFLSLFMLTMTITLVNASTKTKKEAINVSYNNITCVLGNVTAYYDSSTKVISSANVNKTYTTPGCTVNEMGITSLKTYSATGKIKATYSGKSISDSATVTTK